MQKQQSFKQKTTGTLYLVPTPIGNLQDMTFRSVETLKNAALIASEDTRNTQKLLNHFDITVPQKSFHEHNYKERIPQLIEQLQLGTDIAQVSDAGMPSISDPGHELVEACIAADIPVVALPGPTAGLTALIASGLAPQPHYFHGFLPRKKKEQREVLATLREITATLMFYESPYRVGQTIAILAEVLGEERQVVICRELTKIHEEYLRGTLAELTTYLAENDLKGECCLFVEGFQEVETEIVALSTGDLKIAVETLVAEGLKPNAAIKEIAKRQNLKKQEVYAAYHELG